MVGVVLSPFLLRPRRWRSHLPRGRAAQPGDGRRTTATHPGARRTRGRGETDPHPGSLSAIVTVRQRTSSRCLGRAVEDDGAQWDARGPERGAAAVGGTADPARQPHGAGAAATARLPAGAGLESPGEVSPAPLPPRSWRRSRVPGTRSNARAVALGGAVLGGMLALGVGIVLLAGAPHGAGVPAAAGPATSATPAAVARASATVPAPHDLPRDVAAATAPATQATGANSAAMGGDSSAGGYPADAAAAPVSPASAGGAAQPQPTQTVAPSETTAAAPAPQGPQAKLTASLYVTPAEVAAAKAQAAQQQAPKPAVCTPQGGRPCWDAALGLWECPNEVTGAVAPCTPAELHTLQAGLPWYVKAEDCVEGAGCEFGTKFVGSSHH